jgi:hypothetical protein
MAGIKNTHRSAEAERLFKAPEYKCIDGKDVKFSDVKVHEFNMGDVDDPDLYAAHPIMEWQKSEAGKWVMEHAVVSPFWHRSIDPQFYGWKYHIIARLSEQDQTYWTLRWNNAKT